MVEWIGSLLNPLVTKGEHKPEQEGISIPPFTAGESHQEDINGNFIPSLDTLGGKIISGSRGLYLSAFKSGEPVKTMSTLKPGALGFSHGYGSTEEREVEGHDFISIGLGSPGVVHKGFLLQCPNPVGKIVIKSNGYSISTHVQGIQYLTDAEGNHILHAEHNGYTISFPQSAKHVPPKQGYYIPAFIGGFNFTGGTRLKSTYPGIAYSVGIEITPPFEPRIYPKQWHPAVYNGQKKNSQPLVK